MTDFRDYSMMFAVLDDWDKENFESEFERYTDRLKQVRKSLKKHESNIRILSSNADYFEKRIKEFEYEEMKSNFVLKKEHLLLLNRLNINHQHGYIEVDQKRPLGCSYELEGICEALGINQHARQELTEDDEEKLWRLVKELPIAFEHIMKNALDAFQTEK